MDVKETRAAGVVYRNTSRRTIFVIAALVQYGYSGATTMFFTIDSYFGYGSVSMYPGYTSTAYFPVPANGTYSVSMNAGTSYVSQWFELK